MKVFHLFLLIIFAHNVVCQLMFTREERDRILEKHRKKLEQQTEQIFQQRTPISRGSSVYDTANYETIRDYEGQYASVSLGNQSHWTTICSREFVNKEQLVGIDYKRHQSRHFLLCYSKHILVLKTFIIEGGYRINFRQFTTLNYVGSQEIRQALMFHNFQNGQLLIALHMRRSHLSLITTLKLHDMEDETFSLLESGTVHQFEPFEKVVRIEVSHLVDRHKFVALLDGYSDVGYDEKSTNLIRIHIPQANNLETFNVLAQAFIVASNSSEFQVLRVHETRLEKVAHYGFRARIIQIRPLVYGPSHYLFVAGDERQAVYQFDESTSTWKGRALIHKPNIFDAGLLSCSYQREDLFFWIDNGNQSYVYTFDYEAQKFVLKLTSDRNFIANTQFIPGSGHHFSEKGRSYQFRLSNDGKLWLFGYEVSLSGGGFSKRKPFLELHDIVERKLSGLQNNIVKLRETEIISKTITSMSFPFAVKFNKKVITKNLVSHARSSPKQWKIQNMTLGFEDLHADLNQLHTFINQNIQPHLESLEQTLNNRVVYKSKDATFKDTSEFVNQIQVPSVQTNHSAMIDLYDGWFVSEILSNLYRTSVNPPLRGKKSFLADVFVDKNFELNSLNQRPLDSYLYTDLEQDIYTPLWYSNLNVANLQFLGPINANLSLGNVVFINQHHVAPIQLSSRTMFEHLVVDNLHVNHLDNVDIRELPHKVLKRQSESVQVFRVPTHFDTFNAERSFHTNILNGYFPSKLFSNIAFRSGKNIFKAPLHIQGRLSLRHLECTSLNDVEISSDLLDRFSDQVITGRKYFKSAIFGSIVTSSLNGLRIPEDVYIATADEIIPGTITIDRLNLATNLHVNGLIDGVNLTHLDQRHINSLQNRYDSLLFRKKVIVKELQVGGLTDGFNLQDIYSDSIFADSNRVEITAPKRFSGILKTKALRVLGSINNQKLEHYARTDEELSFKSSVSFNSAQFRDVFVNGKIDNVSANDLARRISSLRKNYPIYGPKVFKNLLYVDNLIVRGKINGQIPENYMLYNSAQNITGKIHFSDASFGRMRTSSGVRILETLNNRNVKSFLSSIVFLDKIRPLDMAVHCHNCTIERAQIDFVNNQNFTNFVLNHLSKTRPQKIHAPKHFLVPQYFLNVNTSRGIAGIDVKFINNDAITLNGHNIVRNEVIFDRNLIIRSSAQLSADYFNGRHFKNYLQNAVFVNSSDETIIRGTIQFNAGLHAQNEMNLDLLNRVRPEELFFTKSRNHTVDSEMIFHSNVISGSPLSLSGLLNGHDLQQLSYNTLKKDQNGKLLGNINFDGPMQVDAILVDGLVDGLPLNRNKILFKNSQQDISKLTLNGPARFNKEIEVFSSLNDHDSSLLDQIVYAKGSNEPQIINSTKTFNSIKTLKLIHRDGYFGLPVINGRDIVDFEKTAIYSLVNRTILKSKEFIGQVTFSLPVQIRGLFNGVDLDNDMIILNSVNVQKITGIKHFEDINLRDSVNLYGHVNGINISSLNSAILQDYGGQQIQKSMVFHSPLYLGSDSDVDYLNNVSPNNYLTIKQNHNITGDVQFEHATANRIFSKVVNNVNIEEIIPHLLYVQTNKTQNVQAHITVNNFILEKDLQAEEHINGVDLNIAVERATRNIHSSFNIAELKRDIEYQTNKLQSRAELFEFANFEIEHLSHSIIDDVQLQNAQFYPLEELKNRFRVHETIFETSLTERSDGKIYTIYIAEPNGIRVTFYQEAIVSHVSQVRTFVREGFIYCAFGVSGQNSNMTQSWLKKIPAARPGSKVEIVQVFDERDVTSLEFFADPYGAQYLIFNSLTSTGRSLRVYRANSLENSRFEMVQSLPPLEAITLFSFGHGPTFRQFYLVGLQEFDTFVLYRHDGVFGFQTKWTTRSPALNKNSIFHPIVPLIVQKSKLYFKVHGCTPKVMIQATLNGALEDVQF